MITFLPSTDFEEIARMLDDKRLGGQRTEAWAILKWLRAPDEYSKLVKAGYCSMWRGYEPALVRYLNAMLREWERRGKNNKILTPGNATLGLQESSTPPPMPPWMGQEKLHSCHRSALMAKLPSHYSRFGWKESGEAYDGSYLWPEQDGEGNWMLRWPKASGKPAIPITVSVPSAAGEPSRKRPRHTDDNTDYLDRQALVAEWNLLTKNKLPALAKSQRWPIRLDHCFQRVALDAAFQSCWYDHLDRKKGPAIKQIKSDDLLRAVEAARRMEQEGSKAVIEMDNASLCWRGKTPKRRRT